MPLTMAPAMQPYARSMGTDASRWFLGKTLVTFLATGDDTNGQFSLVESRTRKGVETRAHVHRDEDECFYVVAGEILFTVDGRSFLGRPGSWVVVPRGTVHAFVVESDEATLLVMFTPAGFEGFFQELSVPATSVTIPPAPAGPPDLQRIASVSAKYGSESVVPA